MWLTLSTIMCYAFINIIQKHHLYSKDQNNFKITSIHIKPSSFPIPHSRMRKHLTLLFPPLGYHFLLYSLLTGILLGRVTFHWGVADCVSLSCALLPDCILLTVLSILTSVEGQPTRGEVQPRIFRAGSSLEMASCAFSHMPCSKIFPYPFLFISALIF